MEIKLQHKMFIQLNFQNKEVNLIFLQDRAGK